MRITVLGAGAWGTALASSFSSNGHEVTLWGRTQSQIKEIEKSRCNEKYLPNITLPINLTLTSDLSAAIKDSTIILLVVPAQKTSSICVQIAPELSPGTTLISCAKGIDQASGETMTQMIARLCPQAQIAALSGPSFAVDVASGLPTAVTVATNTKQSALDLCAQISSAQLRCYAGDDLLGVDYGGALKNVLAIAAGIVHGRGLGASAIAAITARGFAELQRISLALGAKPETLTGLSGLGDLILSCSSEKSRNFAYGAAIGRGDNLENMKLAEGVATASIAARIAQDNKIDAPLVQTISKIISKQIDVNTAINTLLVRPVKSELD